MREWKEYFNNLAIRYFELTKKEVNYEHQPGNGNWIIVESDDNNGMGMGISVTGYKEACHIVEGMCISASVMLTGKVNY